MKEYTTVLSAARSRFEDRKSVFYGLCTHVTTEDEALSFIAAAKKEFPDATHHVYAYVLRENSTMRYTDDREPQGTAGMPVLDTIRKSGCTDVCIVVVRYFGGTLLGTGGLVHAYSEAASSALHAAEVITYRIFTTLRLRVSYQDYAKIGALLSSSGLRIKNTDFSDSVLIDGETDAVITDSFLSCLRDLTGGRAIAEITGEKYSY